MDVEVLKIGLVVMVSDSENVWLRFRSESKMLANKSQKAFNYRRTCWKLTRSLEGKVSANFDENLFASIWYLPWAKAGENSANFRSTHGSITLIILSNLPGLISSYTRNCNAVEIPGKLPLDKSETYQIADSQRENFFNFATAAIPLNYSISLLSYKFCRGSEKRSTSPFCLSCFLLTSRN